MNSSSPNHIVLGMAGHIDHGKTELVKALTGTDTDRLKEEKERGMTTDLGFAFLGDDITIIDVPGHEKFVKTMVAGVNTVDMALLVIAADDGVMPQTVEHLEILNLLQVKTGLVALSKIDLVDPGWTAMVADDIRKLLAGTVLDGAAVVPVSPVTGQGMDELRKEIFRVAASVQARKDTGVFRMPIDRVFTIKGFGTVVAGTVLSGRVAPDDTVELLPQGRQLRVRGVQVHDRPVKESAAGFRTAINLLKAEKESIERGDVLVEPGFFRPTSMLDAWFTLLKSWKRELNNRARVRIHVGTAEVMGRIQLLEKKKYSPGQSGFVQVHFEKTIVADAGDRFVVRSYSPLRTIGGGVILDPYPKKHKRSQDEVVDRLKRIFEGDSALQLLEHFNKVRFIPQSVEELAKSLGITAEDCRERLDVLESSGQACRIGSKRWMSVANEEHLKTRTLAVLTEFHDQNPLGYSIAVAKLRTLIRQPVDKSLFDLILSGFREAGVIDLKGDQVRLAGYRVELTPDLETLKKKIVEAFLRAPFSPPNYDDIVNDKGKRADRVLAFLIAAGEIIRLDEKVFFHRTAVDEAMNRIRQLFASGKSEAKMSDFKDCLATSRKYLIPLLEYADRAGITIRDGEVRRFKA